MGEHVYNNSLHPNDLESRPRPRIADPPYVDGDHAALCRECDLLGYTTCDCEPETPLPTSTHLDLDTIRERLDASEGRTYAPPVSREDVRVLLSEVERLRDGLRRIADGDYPVYTGTHHVDAQKFARALLDDQTETT